MKLTEEILQQMIMEELGSLCEDVDRRKKSKKKLYFGPEVQDAIIKYNESSNDSERNKIYGNEIHKAFYKLA